MRISDWSSDVCSSDLVAAASLEQMGETHAGGRAIKIGDIALEPDRAGLALAHAKTLARRLLLELEQRRGGRLGKPRHARDPRSDERGVGNEGVGTCRTRWSLDL